MTAILASIWLVVVMAAVVALILKGVRRG